jgi:hypothetical protein
LSSSFLSGLSQSGVTGCCSVALVCCMSDRKETSECQLDLTLGFLFIVSFILFLARHDNIQGCCFQGELVALCIVGTTFRLSCSFRWPHLFHRSYKLTTPSRVLSPF